MATLRLLPAGPSRPGNIHGEVVSCVYTPDSAFVVSGGWDGQLRLWDASGGAHVSGFRASDKAVTACGVSLDGKTLLSGSMTGMVTLWDSVSHEQKLTFMAHTRPISGLVYSPDGKTLGVSSWDGTLSLWRSFRHEVRVLAGHHDIVSGCCFTPDGHQLVSWSYDMTVRLWEVSTGVQMHEFLGHTDRVCAGAVSPDGHWAVTGSRDGLLRIWDLPGRKEVSAIPVSAEIRSCHFLLDGESLVAVDINGRFSLHSLPFLEERMELVTRLPVQSCDLSPSGGQLALGCGDGRVRFVVVDGFNQNPLLVPATQITKKTQTRIQKLFGRSNITHHFHCVCPTCRKPVDLPTGTSGQAAHCPHCKQKLKITGVTRVVREK